MVVAVMKTVVKVLLTLGMMNFNLRSWMPYTREVTSADIASSDGGSSDDMPDSN